MEMNFQIPFILLPGIFPPPVAGRAPGTGSCEHLSAQPLKSNADRTLCMQLECCGNGRAKDSKAHRGLEAFVLLSWTRDAIAVAACSCGFRGGKKPSYMKLSRAIGVDQRWGADISFAHHIRNACDGEFQFFWIRKTGKKQTALRRARAGGFRSKHDFSNGSAGRI